jgi:hypothetical protein
MPHCCSPPTNLHTPSPHPHTPRRFPPRSRPATTPATTSATSRPSPAPTRAACSSSRCRARASTAAARGCRRRLRGWGGCRRWTLHSTTSAAAPTRWQKSSVRRAGEEGGCSVQALRAVSGSRKGTRDSRAARSAPLTPTAHPPPPSSPSYPPPAAPLAAARVPALHQDRGHAAVLARGQPLPRAAVAQRQPRHHRHCAGLLPQREGGASAFLGGPAVRVLKRAKGLALQAALPRAQPRRRFRPSRAGPLPTSPPGRHLGGDLRLPHRPVRRAAQRGAAGQPAAGSLLHRQACRRPGGAAER